METSPMRDVILIGFIALCLATAIRYPFAGLLTWAWFTIMTPHQAAFGAFGLPLNLIIAAVTITGYVFSNEVSRFKIDAITGLILVFAGWLALSQLFSLDAQNSEPYFERMIKTLIFVLLCIQMTTDKLRFNALVWVVVLGVGFFAAKGALFTFATFGAYRVQGLAQTVLEDNNHFGIAVATILPLILYLRGQASGLWLRRGLLALFCLSVIAIIGTHSRGAFLALLAFGGFFWWGSKHKVSILAGLALLMIPTIAFMPAKWTERMSTIGEATHDASFMGRVDAWVINYKLAKQNPFTGAGLRNSYQPEIAKEVDAERAQRAKAAHSIYFEILGGAGFVGLAFYLSIFAAAFIGARRVQSAKLSLAPWKTEFARYGQLSLIIFMVGGASTSMEMWDGYWVVIALIAALTKMGQTSADSNGSALERARRTSWRQQQRIRGALANHAPAARLTVSALQRPVRSEPY